MIVVDPRNLPVKFGQNRVSNSWDIVVVVIVAVDDVVDVVVVSVVVVSVVVVVIVVFDVVVGVSVVVHVVTVDPRNPPWKFGKNRVGKSWDIADVEFPVVGGGGWWVVVGGGVKSFSCHTQLLSWVEVELGLWQLCVLS